MTFHDDEPRCRYAGKVSMPARRLDLEEDLSDKSRLAVVCRRGAFQYEDRLGLTVLPNLLRLVAAELDRERRDAVALLATGEAGES